MFYELIYFHYHIVTKVVDKLLSTNDDCCKHNVAVSEMNCTVKVYC